jgi:hypothetical protein
VEERRDRVQRERREDEIFAKLSKVEGAVTRLNHAVFGLDDESGLLHEMRGLRSVLGKIYFALLGAILSFLVGTALVIWTGGI